MLPITPDSPCTRICVLDPASGFCIGCGRTGMEIGGWGIADDAARIAIKAELASRMQLMGKSNN